MKEVKKFTCLDHEGNKPKGAIEGTRNQVLAWMKKTFPGIRKAVDQDTFPAWQFFYKGETTTYETQNGDNLYLAEVAEDDKAPKPAKSLSVREMKGKKMKKEEKGHIVLAPSACAADGASLASRVGCKFEKVVKIRIDIRDAKTPDPDHWNFRPESAYVVSAWAGDVQLHLGSVVAAVMKIGGKAAHAELNGFVINPKRIMKIIVALRLYDIVKGRNVNIENLIGLQYSRLELVDIGDMRKINRCVGIVDTRSDVTLQFLKDYHRVRKAMDFDAIEVVLEKTHKFSYEEAVLMIEREFRVCRLVARKLLQEDQHWSDYQYKAGKIIEVGNRMHEVIPYQPKFTK